MTKATAQFALEDGTTVLVEVDPPVAQRADRIATMPGQVVEAQQTFENSLGTVVPAASAILNKIKAGLTNPADEVEVKFGVKLSAETGAIIASVGGEVNFEITLKWNQTKAG